MLAPVFLILLGFATSANSQAYSGCYTRESTALLFKVDLNPPRVEGCVDACEKEYFRYAVVSQSSCSCKNSVGLLEVDSSQCNSTCPGNSVLSCGGPTADSYYLTNVNAPGPVENLQSNGKPSDTSIFIGWSEPKRGTQVDMFEIKATYLKTFSTQVVISPSWRIQAIANKFELSNLHPGTSYNISVTPAFRSEYGGSSFIVAETQIGIPEPEPEEPTILAQDANTATIELVPAVNNNGPVSFYQIIVYFVSNELLQDFDQTLLKGYKESQEDGTPYYIAAELELAQKQRFTVGDGLTYRGYFNAPLPMNRHFHVSIGVVSQLNNVTKVRYARTTHDQHVNSHPNVHIDYVEEGTNKTLIIILTTACIIFGLLLVGSIIGYVYIRLRLDNRRQRLSDSHELQIQGPSTEIENQGFVVDNFENGGSYNDQLQRLVDDVNDERKITRNNLTLDIDNIIGTGSYGDVIRGNIRLNNANFYSCQCQVHVISEDMEKRDQLSFVNEFGSLIAIGQHPNTLSFFGVCQTADWLYLIFEDTQMTLKRRLLDSRVPSYTNNPRFSTMSEEMAMQFMLTVSQTMEFLVEKKIIQRNLCAHNITIDSNGQIKLHIFGPVLYDQSGKSFETARWHAPEVLKYNNHTFKSNVWSMGVLMWEISTLGATPYGNNIPTVDLFSRIRNGARPEQSTHIFDDLYQLFLNCWELEQKDRPSFNEITTYLKQLTTSINHVLTFDRRDGIQLPYHLPLLEIKN